MTDPTSTPEPPDRGHPTALGSPSTADLAKSIQGLRNWLIVLTVLVAFVFMVSAVAVVVASVGVAWSGFSLSDTSPDGLETDAGADAVQKGPPLTSVASLPVDASGEGTIQGFPTGEATANDKRGTFVLVLDPAPAGLPARTTLDVVFDHSTKVYRDGRALDDPLTALNSEGGSFDADPSAAGTVKVQFHIKDGEVFADRLDLSDEYPPGIEP